LKTGKSNIKHDHRPIGDLIAQAAGFGYEVAD